MNTKPIIFSAPMIRALQDGSKTQTRRIIKAKEVFISASGAVLDMADGNIKEIKFPYGEQGGYLWCRETWHQDPAERMVDYRADGQPGSIRDDEWSLWKWKPSIYMPRWASRITLKMTGLRVDRLQGISEADAIAEGIEQEDDHWKDYLDGDSSYAASPIFSYKSLWESINGEGSWESNPFVWVLEFTVIKQNIDAVLTASNKLHIYASTNHGESWQKIQEGSK